MGNKQVWVPQKVTIEQLPELINKTFDKMTLFNTEIENASKKAKERSLEAMQKKTGRSFFRDNKKDAIEALQDAVIGQANVLDDSIKAIKDLFENQEKFAKCISYLYGLGVTSIAANRTVLRELEFKLREASEEELSELARQEIEAVILQLRAQENIQNKIDRNERILREHREGLYKLQSNNKTLLERVKNLEEVINNKSFLETMWYKASVGVATLAALGISIVSIL